MSVGPMGGILGSAAGAPLARTKGGEGLCPGKPAEHESLARGFQDARVDHARR